MIRYFLGRELAHRLDIPLARWKRWGREFLPPDPLGGLQSGYARHYSIDEAFTVFLAGQLVSRSRFSIPESRQILSDLDPWLTREGYRTGTMADNGSQSDGPATVYEHLILIDHHPSGDQRTRAFDYSVRSILAHRHRTGQGRQIEEEQYLTTRLGAGQETGPPSPPRQQWLIWITRILLHFSVCLELNAHLFGAPRRQADER